MDDSARQQILDEEHLRLLRIGYFVMGGTAGLGVLFGVIYVLMGLLFTTMLAAAPQHSAEPPPVFMGWIFIAVGGFVLVFATAYMVFAFLTAKALRLRRSRTLCLVTAAITSLHLPFGTVLGIMTFSVLDRPSVRGMFGVGTGSSRPPAS